jgi:hypothetical protein
MLELDRQHLHKHLLYHSMWQLHLLSMHHHLCTPLNNRIINNTKEGDVEEIAGAVEGEILEDNMSLQRYREFLQQLHLLQHLHLFRAFQQHLLIWHRLLTNLLFRTLQNSTTIGICVFRVDGMYLLGTPVKHATCLERIIKLVVLVKMLKHT